MLYRSESFHILALQLVRGSWNWTVPMALGGPTSTELGIICPLRVEKSLIGVDTCPYCNIFNPSTGKDYSFFPDFGASPSGKAPDFDSGIRRFDPFRPSHKFFLH